MLQCFAPPSFLEVFALATEESFSMLLSKGWQIFSVKTVNNVAFEAPYDLCLTFFHFIL